jgi:hypothetical protein
MGKHRTLRQREAALDGCLGKLTCSLDMGGDSPDPDPMVGQAAAMNAEVAKDAWGYYKDLDQKYEPYRQEAIKAALEQSKIQAATAAKQNQQADEAYQFTKNLYRPAEEKLVAAAMGFDTPERREQEAGQAMADVGSQVDLARASTVRELADRGVDASSGNAAVALSRMALGEGAAKAAAGNTARKNVEAVGRAQLADVAALGRGMATQNATATQLGLQAGNSSVGNAQVPLNVGAQQGSQYAQGAGVTMQGYTNAGNIGVQQYNAQKPADNSGMWGALGSVAGSALMAFSDEDMKEGIKPASDEEALDAVRATPVEQWSYKDGTPASDGGKKHIGPMAQKVAASMGMEVAPGGKTIDLVSMNGIVLGAVRALDKKLSKVAASAGLQPA